jgi:hypothetical protein
MTQEEIISEAFEAICFGMALHDYEQVSLIVTYLTLMTEFMSDNQIEQLCVTQKRLEYLAKEHKC